jgi:hypothetical protein
MGVVLIIVFVAGLVAARLAYRSLEMRLGKPSRTRDPAP